MQRQLRRLPDTPEPMELVELDSGITVASDAWGPSDGRPVVLLHGGGQTRHAWRRVGERLGEAGHRAVAVDLRGHGDSSWPTDGDYTYDGFVADVVAYLDAERIDRPILVGASLGGAIALVAVGEHFVDATALVVVDTAPRLEQSGVDGLRRFMTQREDGYASLDEVADAIDAYNPHRARARNLRGLAKNVRLDDAGRFHWHWDPRFMRGDGTSAAEWEQRQQRLERCARDVAIPTLLVRGGSSNLVSEEGAQAFLELCPRAEYVNIADASHMVVGDRNDRFGGAVVDFLARAVPSGDPQ